MTEIDLTSTANMSFKPNLYDVNIILDEFIVGENRSRMALFTNYILGHRNVNITGPRASGKTHLVTSVSKLLPDRNGLYNISKGSDKSGWYQAEALKAHSHIIIPELNKIPKDVLEVLKDWGEDKDSEYRTTISDGAQRRIQKFILPRKPFVFTLADEEELKIDEQLRSRLTVIRTDSSEDMNKAVNTQQAELAMLPVNPKKPDTQLFSDMKIHMMTLPPLAKCEFRHIAATSFVNAIPHNFPDCRRDFPKYLANTYGITRFFWKERMKIHLDKDKYAFLVTPEDMYLNHIIYGTTLVESSLRCSSMERYLIDILKSSESPVNTSFIQSTIRKKGLTISNLMINKHLAELADLGYVEVINMTSKIVQYKIGHMFTDFSFNISWKEVVDNCIKNIKMYYPEFEKEYVDRFCNVPIVIHPFTGERIDIMNLEPEKKPKKMRGIV